MEFHSLVQVYILSRFYQRVTVTAFGDEEIGPSIWQHKSISKSILTLVQIKLAFIAQRSAEATHGRHMDIDNAQ